MYGYHVVFQNVASNGRLIVRWTSFGQLHWKPNRSWINRSNSRVLHLHVLRK
ncbi:unnamed protein product [Periconia digitata]|uniref:Uncharacterized protein n=1 Tax=Periconia digitata TaxID=1303443 RepID=A0A9W4UM69_9PLEO|nr:unnamed protein product [Periconia digitata]